MPRAATISRQKFPEHERRKPGPGLWRFVLHLHGIMTPGDRLLFFVLLGIGLFSILSLRLLFEPGRTASVFVGNRLLKTISLGSDETHLIHGVAGTIELRVAQDGLRVTQSTCPEKICMRQGAISNKGQIIVCAPNRMIITIDGEAGHSLDAVTP
jgi:hypothetical protein